MTAKKILIHGDPVDGFTFIGPFTDSEFAGYWAERDRIVRNDNWWIADLVNPNQEGRGGD